MRVVVTGARGQLGTDFVQVLGKEHEVFGFSHQELDVTDFDHTVEIITNLSPDIVIHAAAYTDVDGCELDPDKAYKVNALGTQNVAVACQKTNSSMLYISTDFVFDGRKTEPYTEFDIPNPISVYGSSKLAGERYVSSLLLRYFIVRTAWLYGKHGKNFVKTILRLAEEREELKVVNDQIGSPTYSLDLVQAIAKLINTEWYGIYHITNSGNCSWFDFARKILEYAGKKEIKVKSIGSAELNRPAKRPAFSVLRNYCLELRGFPALRNYEDALKEYLSCLPAGKQLKL
ncbi:MAG: dTDP-4-dehydrorhamnose reductase [Actinomycetota bacterium]|nr:dTDP-4-dehydrorhamnose reductase [Actinomycetota bacterium]